MLMMRPYSCWHEQVMRARRSELNFRSRGNTHGFVLKPTDQGSEPGWAGLHPGGFLARFKRSPDLNQFLQLTKFRSLFSLQCARIQRSRIEFAQLVILQPPDQ